MKNVALLLFWSIVLASCIMVLNGCGDVDVSSEPTPVTDVQAYGPDPVCSAANGFYVPNQITRCTWINRPDLALCSYHVPNSNTTFVVNGCQVWNCYLKPGVPYPICGYTDCVPSC